MDEAVRARTAAREAVDDITPAPLRELIDTRLQNATMTPGVLARLSARAADGDGDSEELDRRTAGVQLIYDGLRLIRTLARTDPWSDGERATAADMDILAADVLVARGFSLLARTEAAPRAVETVRAFGRDETNRAAGRPDPDLAGRTLEADVFELAIIAGASAAGRDRPAGAREFAVELAKSLDRRPDAPASDRLSESAAEALRDLVAERSPSATATDQTWAGSSVTDP